MIAWLRQKLCKDFSNEKSLLVQQIEERDKLLKHQQEQIDKFNNDEEKRNFLEDYWNNKYPMAKITYKCRPLPSSKTKISVPVNVFLTPFDPFIIADLKEWGLYQTKEDYETLVPEIYRNIFKKYYKYVLDEPQFGIDEVWLFPFELRETKKGDCEDWANLQMSYYLAAGVPDWMVRGVAGECDLGSHATVYVYSPNRAKFVHLNSTYSSVYDTLAEFPTHKDAEEGRDKLGIKSVWFSYTAKSGFYSFNQEQTEANIKGFLIKKEG